MKGPGINDYLRILQQKKQEAHDRGEKWIEISSKELHQEVSPEHATMPTCCQAIYKLLYQGDEILQRPKGQTGFGSHLRVRYYVDNLNDREAMFPPKKRGRPAKSEEQKRRDRMLKSSRNTEDLRRILAAWLNERGWQTTEFPNKIQAEKDGITWIIEVQGTHRGRRQPLPVKINAILKDISEDTASSVRYSIAFNDSSVYRKQWSEIPKVVKNKLNVSVILADKSGNIQEVK